jgi:hypothetical protein
MKLFAFSFWRLREFFRIYDDGFSEWKALAVILCTAACAILVACFITTTILQCRLLPVSRLSGLAILAMMGLASLTAAFVMPRARNLVAMYEEEFNSLGSRDRVIGTVLTFLFAILVFVLMLFTGNLARKSATHRCGSTHAALDASETAGYSLARHSVVAELELQ